MRKGAFTSLHQHQKSVVRSSQNRKHDSEGSAADDNQVLLLLRPSAGRGCVHTHRVHRMDSPAAVCAQPGAREFRNKGFGGV